MSEQPQSMNSAGDGEPATLAAGSAASDIPATEVWLYPGRTSLNVVPGILEMRGRRIVFTPSAGISKKPAAQLEEWTGKVGLAERLQLDSPVTVLDVGLDEVNAKAVKGSFGAVLDVEALGHRWRFQFYPMVAGVGLGAIIALPLLISNMRKGRAKAAPWRAALTGAKSHSN